MKTADYRWWLARVKDIYGDGDSLPVLTGTDYGLWLDLSPFMKGDADNRLKLVSDVLKRPSGKKGSYGLGVVEDDKYMRAFYTGHTPGVAKGECVVTVVTLREWPAYVRFMVR